MTVHESCRIGIGAATRNAPKPATGNRQPWPLATRSRSTGNLGLWPRDRVQPVTLAFGHAIAFNLQPWPLATLREQPWPLTTLREQPLTVNLVILLNHFCSPLPDAIPLLGAISIPICEFIFKFALLVSNLGSVAFWQLSLFF